MEQSKTEHVVESWDEAVRVGAEELGMDEAELRRQIDAVRFVPTESDEPVTTAEQDD